MSANAKFKWFPQQYVIFFLAIIFINGCAGSVISVQDLMDTHTEVNSAPIIDASLGVVTLGYVPKDEIKGEMWRQALKLKLNRSNIFSPNATRRINVVIQKLDITHPNFGATMIAEAQGTYSASSIKNDFFYETTVISKGRAAWDEHFVGAIRGARAYNRSIANNFIEFVQRFQTHAKTNIPAIEKLDQDYHGDMQKKVQQSPISSDQKTAWYTAIQKLEAGNQFQKNGAYDKAIENFQQALTLFRKIGAEEWIATSLGNIGNVYNSRGQYDKAIENYQQALTIARKLGSENMVSKSLMNIEKAKKNIILKEAKE